MLLNLCQPIYRECKTCKEIKQESMEFFYYRKDSGKFRTECVECNKAQKKDQRVSNRDFINKRQREKYATCERTRDRAKEIKLKLNFGLSMEEYNEMYADQEGCCAICGTHQSELKKSLSVDHCHNTNKVRDLLCMKCNFALGYAKEDINILNSCISYLNKHKE